MIVVLLLVPVPNAWRWWWCWWWWASVERDWNWGCNWMLLVSHVIECLDEIWWWHRNDVSHIKIIPFLVQYSIWIDWNMIWSARGRAGEGWLSEWGLNAVMMWNSGWMNWKIVHNDDYELEKGRGNWHFNWLNLIYEIIWQSMKEKEGYSIFIHIGTYLGINRKFFCCCVNVTWTQSFNWI